MGNYISAAAVGGTEYYKGDRPIKIRMDFARLGRGLTVGLSFLEKTIWKSGMTYMSTINSKVANNNLIEHV